MLRFLGQLFFVVSISLAVAGCSSPSSSPSTNSDHSSDLGNDSGACDTMLDGRALVESACLTCHSSTLSGAARASAPEGVDFDDDAKTARWSERIRL